MRVVWLQILVCKSGRFDDFCSEKVLECKVCILVVVGQLEMLLTFLKFLFFFFLLDWSLFFCFSRFLAMPRIRNGGLVPENKKNKAFKVHD